MGGDFHGEGGTGQELSCAPVQILSDWRDLVSSWSRSGPDVEGTASSAAVRHGIRSRWTPSDGESVNDRLENTF